jgi:pimeloyl-ACP methyl ester carboxylesterase
MIRILRFGHGNRLAYTDFGNRQGFPLLIQHGLIASIHDEGLFGSLIENGRRLISMARPGYGESSPYPMENLAEWGEIVSRLVEELGLPQFDVLGMSSGAPYSYAIGYRLPEKTRRIYIFSGVPALYDAAILKQWPYPVDKSASLPELEMLAKQIFFSNLTPGDLAKNDIHDSMMNHCFGVAQDLKLRPLDWGFRLGELRTAVTMEHCRADADVPLITAEMTARLIPDCRFSIREAGGHFSEQTLDGFLRRVMLGGNSDL